MRTIAGALVMLCCMPPMAIGQERSLPNVARSHEGSTLSPTDSISLAEAAARAALAAPDGRVAWVVAIDDSVGGRVGSAFVHAGRRSATAMPPASDSAGVHRFTLLGVHVADTAIVRLRVAGTAPPPSRAFWVNDFDYSFVRTAGTP